MLASTVQVGSFRHRIRSARDGHHRRVDQRDLPVARATALRHAAESRRGQRRRVAGRRGRDGHRHRVVVVSSDSAVSSTVADVAEPPALPVKVTVDPESATPVGLPDSDSVKSVPSAPPARTPADPPGSPPRTAHGPGQHQLRRVAPTPSVAVVSGVVRTTVVGSSSITVNEADDGSPTV